MVQLGPAYCSSKPILFPPEYIARLFPTLTVVRGCSVSTSAQLNVVTSDVLPSSPWEASSLNLHTLLFAFWWSKGEGKSKAPGGNGATRGKDCDRQEFLPSRAGMWYKWEEHFHKLLLCSATEIRGFLGTAVSLPWRIYMWGFKVRDLDLCFSSVTSLVKTLASCLISWSLSFLVSKTGKIGQLRALSKIKCM